MIRLAKKLAIQTEQLEFGEDSPHLAKAREAGTGNVIRGHQSFQPDWRHVCD
jgi:hypothetical protein